MITWQVQLEPEELQVRHKEQPEHRAAPGEEDPAGPEDEVGEVERGVLVGLPEESGQCTAERSGGGIHPEPGE